MNSKISFARIGVLTLLIGSILTHAAWAISCIERVKSTGSPTAIITPIELTAEEIKVALPALKKVGQKPHLKPVEGGFIYIFPMMSEKDLDIVGYAGKRLYNRPNITTRVDGFTRKAADASSDQGAKLADESIQSDILKTEEKKLVIYSPTQNRIKHIILESDETYQDFLAIGENHKLLVTLREEHGIGFNSTKKSTHIVDIYSFEDTGYTLVSIKFTDFKDRPRVGIYSGAENEALIKVGDDRIFRLDLKRLKNEADAPAPPSKVSPYPGWTSTTT